MNEDKIKFYKDNKQKIKEFLIAKGFKEFKPDLLSYWYRDEEVTLYHDLRGDTRRSYAFKRGAGSVKHKDYNEYIMIKSFEERLRCKSLDGFSSKGITPANNNNLKITSEISDSELESHPEVIEEDMTQYAVKEVNPNVAPVDGDKIEEILFHLTSLLNALNMPNVSYHAVELKQIINKMGYKMKGE